MLILIIAAIFGIFGAIVASERGRNGFGWFIICFLFPAIGLIALFFMSNLKQEAEETKSCPQCAERVKKQALICKHCSYKFEKQTTEHSESLPKEPGKAFTSPDNSTWTCKCGTENKLDYSEQFQNCTSCHMNRDFALGNK